MKSNSKLVLLILFCTTYAYTELPRKIDPFVNCVPAGIKYGYTQPFGKIYGFPIVRIFGWSKDGKLCYSIQRNIEGRGGVITSYIIQDLITDSFLWRHDDDSFKWETEINDIDSIAETSYNNNQKIIESFCSNYKIILDESILSNVDTLQSKGITIKLNITTNKKDSLGFNNVSYEIIAKRNDNKQKVIASRKNITADNVYICGYMNSPYENRIALIIAEEKYVFEGNELFYSIVGCLTDAGYK
jgi:hypothetical protein